MYGIKLSNTVISDGQVRDRLAGITVTESAGPDGINRKLLKDACENLAKHLKPSAHLINYHLSDHQCGISAGKSCASQILKLCDGS